jgi:hypothetical protein
MASKERRENFSIDPEEMIEGRESGWRRSRKAALAR